MAWTGLAVDFLESGALLLEVAAAVIILAGGAVALGRWAVRRGPFDGPSHARHNFARSLLLALDFTIGSDVLSLACLLYTSPSPRD